MSASEPHSKGITPPQGSKPPAGDATDRLRRLVVLRDQLAAALTNEDVRADLVREYRLTLAELANPADRRERLVELRDKLTEALARGVRADLAAQYRLVLTELDGLPEEGARAVVDEVRRAREARQAAAALGVDSKGAHPRRR